MSHTGKSYDVTVAIATMLLAAPDAPQADLKAMLVAGSDIPEDKLDFALSELADGLQGMRGMVQLQAMLMGRQPTMTEVQSMVAGAEWIDDDKGAATYTTHIVDEEGNGSEITVKTHIKAKR